MKDTFCVQECHRMHELPEREEESALQAAHLEARSEELMAAITEMNKVEPAKTTFLRVLVGVHDFQCGYQSHNRMCDIAIQVKQ